MDSLIQKNQILRMKFRMADKNGHFEHLFLGSLFVRHHLFLMTPSSFVSFVNNNNHIKGIRLKEVPWLE